MQLFSKMDYSLNPNWRWISLIRVSKSWALADWQDLSKRKSISRQRFIMQNLTTRPRKWSNRSLALQSHLVIIATSLLTINSRHLARDLMKETTMPIDLRHLYWTQMKNHWVLIKEHPTDRVPEQLNLRQTLVISPTCLIVVIFIGKTGKLARWWTTELPWIILTITADFSLVTLTISSTEACQIILVHSITLWMNREWAMMVDRIKVISKSTGLESDREKTEPIHTLRIVHPAQVSSWKIRRSMLLTLAITIQLPKTGSRDRIRSCSLSPRSLPSSTKLMMTSDSWYISWKASKQATVEDSLPKLSERSAEER